MVQPAVIHVHLYTGTLGLAYERGYAHESQLAGLVAFVCCRSLACTYVCAVKPCKSCPLKSGLAWVLIKYKLCNFICWGVRVRVGLWFSVYNTVEGGGRQLTAGDHSWHYSTM